MTKLERQRQIATAFNECFGGAPLVWARAPGRVDLMGSHTDYNLGYVLALPIGRDLWIAARPREDRIIRLHSLNFNAASSIDLNRIQHDATQPWSNYVRAVAFVLSEEGYALKGFDAVLHGTVPIGSGLSSSAALECAAAVVFEAIGGFCLDPVNRALLCQRAENQFVGVNCGILDQYTSCMGREGAAVQLDCRDLSSRPVALPPGVKIVICDTRAKRELSGSEYGSRRAQCEEGARLLGVKALRDITPKDYRRREPELPVEIAKRCRFIVEENARVLELCDAFQRTDQAAIRQITEASFHGACHLYEIAAPAMLAMMKAMHGAPGAIGARQAGAGFGGCMVAFVEEALTGEFASAVQENYTTATGIDPKVYTVEAVAGAGLIL